MLPVTRSVVLCAVVAGCALLAGCGVPPELQPKPGSEVPQPSDSASEDEFGFESEPPWPDPSAEAPLPDDTASPSPGFAEEYAVPCTGRPGANQVIALVRRTGGFLPATGSVTVVKGPLCAGSWQYTILSVPRKEPLQVVSRGTPDNLTLVTAGTDICSVQVRTQAPVGIRNAALCPAPAGR